MRTSPGVSPRHGLSEGAAREVLRAHGPNEIADRERQGLVRTLGGVLTEPMFLLLLVGAALYLAIGNLGEGGLLAFFALTTIGLVVLQERRSERALNALRSLAAPQVRVVRDGEVRRIGARELVPGDVFLLAEGERIAADAVVREATQLAVDESLLTGESVAVRKIADATGPAAPGPAHAGGDDLPFAYAGTLVVAGHGIAEVTATGRRTRVGQIGASLAGIDRAPTPLECQLARLVRVIGIGGLVLCLLLVAWYGWRRGDWLQGLLSGIALAMALLPEEFPMVLAVFLALGAWRLAKIQMLARRPAVIEALGAATVLCVDKTGTLTENRMRLRRLVTDGADVDLDDDAPLPESVHRLLEIGMLASRRGGADPIDLAMLSRGDAALASTEHLHPGWTLRREYPLTPALLAMSQSWDGEGAARQVAAKGAPEAVIDLCHLGRDAARDWLRRVDALAQEGLRVIAVAHAIARAAEPLADQHDHDFVMLGLAAFEDPLRAGVPAAVAQARAAGIAVAMVTGDHPATALAIARRAGIDIRAGALAGDRIAALDDAALAQALASVRVFARVTPEQKLRLVQAFKANGEVVAMTGDGVNDAPALKAAHIGIAMGARGTDVAREAAGLVLLDDDFDRIVGGVRMGRRIFDNLRKVMTYIVAIHVPIAGLALLPLLLGLPPLLLPAHVVLVQMVVDPACSLAFEGAPAASGLMRRPPRRAGERLVGWPMLGQGLVQGGAVLLATLAAYAWALDAGRSEPVARALAVVGLMAGNLLLVWTNATEGGGARAMLGRAGLAFWAVAVGASAVLVAALALPPLRRLLHFGVPAPIELAGVLAAVALAQVLGAAAARRLRRVAGARPPA
jgi:Ca2+-transporting ATPase